MICSYEIYLWAGATEGLDKVQADEHRRALDPTDFGKVKVCFCHSFKRACPDGTYGGNPMGFLIESGSGNFYYAGDTALTYDMKLIGDYKNIDFAFLPIGNNFTVWN